MSIDIIKQSITIPQALSCFLPGTAIPSPGKTSKSPLRNDSGSHCFWITPDAKWWADFGWPVSDNQRGYASGDVVDLVRYLLGVNTAEAVKELEKAFFKGGKAQTPSSYAYQPPKRHEARTLTSDELDQAYRIFLSYAGPDAKALATLSQRGISKADALLYRFSTFPNPKIMKDVCKKLADLQISADSVPGFYTKKNADTATFYRRDAIIIPIQTAAGKIEGLQLRYYEPGDGPRYVWFSSRNATTKNCKHDGKSPGTPIGFVDGVKRNKKNLFVTEGMFKAIAINKCFKCPVLSVQGVGNFAGIEAQVETVLQTYPIERILIAYDADFIGNISVTLNAIRMYQLLSQKFPDIRFEYVLWDEALGKGIDDLIANVGGYSGKIKTIDMAVFEAAYQEIEAKCRELMLAGKKSEIKRLMLASLEQQINKKG